MWEFNKKPEPQARVVEVATKQTLSDEERDLQHRKIAQLDYIAFLLERLVWLAAPGNLEFDAYQKVIKDFYASQLRQEQESV